MNHRKKDVMQNNCNSGMQIWKHFITVSQLAMSYPLRFSRTFGYTCVK